MDRVWTRERAWAWYRSQPPVLGCNFIPSTAVNQLEFWQAKTFDLETIGRELGWAAGLGLNTVRIYLHDLVWQADGEAFLDRVDAVLALGAQHGLRAIVVLLDDCWTSEPRLGGQPDPRPGVHNSRWVQSPGEATVLAGPTEWERLERYVRAVLTRFGHDSRVLFWDLYNEPGNGRMGARSRALLTSVFQWARSVAPDQPLTAGLWFRSHPLNRLQLDLSDVVTFHCYEPPRGLARWIAWLRRAGRPLVCTEWMARPTGSTVEACLPVFEQEEVGCVAWGLVSGKTNTVFPWPWFGGALRLRGPLGWVLDWYLARPAQKTSVPEVWFHDLLYPDGRPFSDAEAERLRSSRQSGQRGQHVAGAPR